MKSSFKRKEPDGVDEMAGRYVFQTLQWSYAWPDYMITSKKRNMAESVIEIFQSTIAFWPFAIGALFVFFILCVLFTKKPGNPLVIISIIILVACVILFVIWWIIYKFSIKYKEYAETKFSIYYNRWDADVMRTYREKYIRDDKWKFLEPKEPGPARQGDFCYAGFESEGESESIKTEEREESKEEEAHGEELFSEEQKQEAQDGSGIDLRLVGNDDGVCDSDGSGADDSGDIPDDVGTGEPVDIVDEETPLCSDTGRDPETEQEGAQVDDAPEAEITETAEEESITEAPETSYLEEVLKAENLEDLIVVLKKYRL